MHAIYPVYQTDMVTAAPLCGLGHLSSQRFNTWNHEPQLAPQSQVPSLASIPIRSTTRGSITCVSFSRETPVSKHRFPVALRLKHPDQNMHRGIEWKLLKLWKWRLSPRTSQEHFSSPGSIWAGDALFSSFIGLRHCGHGLKFMNPSILAQQKE